jgi:hypothetical protein
MEASISLTIWLRSGIFWPSGREIVPIIILWCGVALPLLLALALALVLGALPDAVLVPLDVLVPLLMVVLVAVGALGIFWMMRWTQSSWSIW